MDPSSLSDAVRRKAMELGFQGCGFSRVSRLEDEARKLDAWLGMGYHADMEWMERHADLRIDPTRLVPGAKTVISVLAGYRFEENEQIDKWRDGPGIAKYARGRDYHKVLKKKLHLLLDHIRELAGTVEARVFVDSAPVMEKAWAARGGLGWLGKNGNLLNRSIGSWFLLGEIILDVDFEPDGPVTDHCGSCTRCIDACPTQAIVQPSVIDSGRCISYLTIEWKRTMPAERIKELNGWAFGCDICQDVCPWNRRSAQGMFDDLRPKAFHRERGSYDDWLELNEDGFKEIFSGTPLMRSGWDKLIVTVKDMAESFRPASQMPFRMNPDDPSNSFEAPPEP
jgi:epoxyqueuosine reductase